MSLARQYTKQAVFLLSTYITIFSFERKFTAVIYNWETAVSLLSFSEVCCRLVPPFTKCHV